MNTQYNAVKNNTLKNFTSVTHGISLAASLLIFSFFAPAWGQSLGCYESARSTTSLDNATALRLCCNKNSAAPVSCFNRARVETTMGDDDALTLCTCASNTRPVDCFNAAAAQTTLDTSDTLRVCARDPERGFTPTQMAAPQANGNSATTPPPTSVLTKAPSFTGAAQAPMPTGTVRAQ